MPGDRPEESLQTGQRFGNYLVRECIGRGGMARVYRAQHVELGKVVALKVLDRDRLDHPQWRQRFLREAQAAAALGHPNIVDVTDVGVEADVPFLVMEFLEGCDLAAHLADKGRLSEQEMADLLLPIVAGLGFAHDCRIVHRDIKPSNIFLARLQDGSLVPKLLDFGIAKSSTFLGERTDALVTDTHQVIGTPMFMAPEALDGARHLTERSDQYSLALVMYQCLTGCAPFESQSQGSLFRAIASGAYLPLREARSDVSRTAERLLEQALALDPERRFSHVREMGTLLYSLASPRSRVLWASTFGREGGAEHDLAGERATSGARRRALALAASASFILLTAGFVQVLRSSEPRPGGLPARGEAPPAALSAAALSLSSGSEAAPAGPAAPRELPEPPGARGERPPAAGLSGPQATRSGRRPRSPAEPAREARRLEAERGRSEPPQPEPSGAERSARRAEQDELRELFPVLGGGGGPVGARRDPARDRALAIPE